MINITSLYQLPAVLWLRYTDWLHVRTTEVATVSPGTTASRTELTITLGITLGWYWVISWEDMTREEASLEEQEET